MNCALASGGGHCTKEGSSLHRSVTFAPLFDQALGHGHARARRELEQRKLADARATNEHVHLLAELLGVVTDPAVPDNEVRAQILARIAPQEAPRADTAGYSDIIFALFDLLGLEFTPRLAGVADKRLYRLNDAPDTPAGRLLTNPLDTEAIAGRWYDLLRVAASLKQGTVTAMKAARCRIPSWPPPRDRSAALASSCTA